MAPVQPCPVLLQAALQFCDFFIECFGLGPDALHPAPCVLWDCAGPSCHRPLDMVVLGRLPSGSSGHALPVPFTAELRPQRLRQCRYVHADTEVVIPNGWVPQQLVQEAFREPSSLGDRRVPLYPAHRDNHCQLQVGQLDFQLLLSAGPRSKTCASSSPLPSDTQPVDTAMLHSAQSR